jgi:hypothetical protein
MSINKQNFKEVGYCIVKSAISQELRDFITQYALFESAQNFAPEADGEQVPGTHAKYADPAMESILLHLHSIIETNTGLSLYPTYSYYRIYKNGDELAPHVDRKSCEISATVCFNFDYSDPEYKWPIFVEGKQVEQSAGDLLIYRGCDVNHWREKLQSSDHAWHVQGFFHYVDANGPNADCKYDGRSMIGTLSNTRTNTSQTPQPKVNSTVKSKEKSYIQYTQ